MMKQHILDEIQRTAKENGGVPLGRERFLHETGIKYTDWYGRYWVRWSDAVREAGFVANKLQPAYPDDRLIEKLIGLIREAGRFPVQGDLRLKRRTDPDFPSHNAFGRLGSKGQLASRVLEYCRSHDGFDDVARLCAEVSPDKGSDEPQEGAPDEPIGYVYLSKVGRFYKIGKTNAVGRRERELAIQLPEKSRTVHAIRTDDPTGIEAYWHARFASKRQHGEWFRLDASDVSAFKRRKFM